MATITANTALDFTTLNLNNLATADGADFFDNANQTFNGIVYQDVIEVWDSLGNGQYASWFFGGTGITVNASQAVTGGTVTGFVDAITNDSGIVSVNWAIQNFSYSAKSIYDAGVSAQTSDDAAVISAILGGVDTFDLSAGADYVRGFAGNDIIRGAAGNDQLWGDAGADRLEGGVGNDKLTGGTEVDIMLGGAGNDTYYVDVSTDKVYETTGTATTVNAGGVDTVWSTANFSLQAYAGVKFVENLTLYGTANVNATGNGLANTLLGNSGNNVIDGRGGNDILKGGLGADKLIGGTGLDVLWLGADAAADIIDVNTIADSAVGGTNRDRVYQFIRGDDHIDLQTLDANTGVTGNQAFAFSAGPAANSVWVVDYVDDVLVRGDVNGDTIHDFEIRVMLTATLDATDLIL